MARKKATDKPASSKVIEPMKGAEIPIPAPFGLPSTITLSPDTEVLYFIDNGRSIPYPLRAGVILGFVQGQLTVVSALNPVPDPGKILEKSDTATSRALAPIPVVKSAKVLTDKGQWNFLYIRERRALCIIGAIDIDSSLKEGGQFELSGYQFDLREGFLHIQKVANTIVIETVTTGI
jgi:hypothetical protein